MLHFWYQASQYSALNHPQSEQREGGPATCAQHFVLEHRYCELVVFVSWFSFHCCFSSYMRRPYCTHGILGWSPTLKTNVGLQLRLPPPCLTSNDVSAISRMRLNFIHQQWLSTMTIHFWSQLICVRNPDRTFKGCQKSTYFKHVLLLPVLVRALDVTMPNMHLYDSNHWYTDLLGHSKTACIHPTGVLSWVSEADSYHAYLPQH